MVNRITVLLLVMLLCNSQPSHAQNIAKSSTEPLGYLPSTAYVLLPTNGPIVTQVTTRRTGAKGMEYLDLINVILPESFVRQQLTQSHDIGFTGLFIHDELLVTMAVLPEHTSGRVRWVPVKPDTLAASRKDCYTRLFNYKAMGGPEVDWSRRRMDLHHIIQRGTRYFTTQQPVLTEYYVLRSHPTWYPTIGDNATINCQARAFTKRDYAKQLETIKASVPPGQPVPRLRGELGTKLLLQDKEKGIYTFWSLAPSIMDGGIIEFGAGELRFKPAVGIISGKYASYFNLSEASPLNRFFDLIDIQRLTGQ
jgi:hypothetical protein